VNQHRTYRNQVRKDTLVGFQVVVKETDLFVHANRPLVNMTRELVIQCRRDIEAYIRRFPEFAQTLAPWRIDGPEPLIIREMAEASAAVGIGPMGAVAGAVAEFVGRALLSQTEEVVVENGGDIFLKKNSPSIIGIFAGKSPFSLKIGLQILRKEEPVAVCTSSGTVGHSLSMGTADAVCVVSNAGALADAAATAIGNRVTSAKEIQAAINFGKSIPDIRGIVVIVADKIGLWGELALVPLAEKRP
jgi:ApbE superfamily uncharacterized protein (UPF0280 family)